MGVMEKVFRHYLREDVGAEIAKFCRGRWVAVECLSRAGRRIFHRYWDGGVPLKISEPSDLKRILNRFGSMAPRTIYGSANIYRDLSSRELLGREDNVIYATPSWDVDGSLDEVDLVKEAAAIIVDELRGNGVEDSLYLIWSGRGIHIHLHEKAVGGEVWRRGPLRVSYSIVEYVLRNARSRLLEVCARSRDPERRLKVENLMDVQRVFTAPLSLHRELDLVAITINPDELDDFEISWARVDDFRYWRNWVGYREGEADELALRALGEVSGAERTRVSLGGGEKVATRTRPARSIGRFQVMALLQAARYYVLRGDLNSAKSFGLNRAIFYAWAKRRGVAVGGSGGRGAASAGRAEEVEERVGGEVAFRSPRGWFSIGGQAQRPVDFDRQVAARFGGEFEKYWRAALKYLRNFPREVLESQREFYENIYLPVRDDPRKLLEFLERGGDPGASSADSK